MIKFIELFAGIGGFRNGLEMVYQKDREQISGSPKRQEEIGNTRDELFRAKRNNGCIGQSSKEYTCIWANEIDKYACQIYRRNYGTKKEPKSNIQPKDSAVLESESPQHRGHPLHQGVQGENKSDRECRERTRGTECVRSNRNSTDSKGESWKDNESAFDERSKLYEGDITKVNTEEIPDHDLLVGGFPCQAFSIAGKRGGFEDTRGTLFFEIARIAQEKRPRLILLENVKGLLSHDKGRTFGAILTTLDEIGYDCQWQVLNSKNFGVPQNRERVFIVGQRKNNRQIPIFPVEYNLKEDGYEITKEEKVYLLSERISEDIGIFLADISFTEKKQVSKQQMQKLLTSLKQGIQSKECSEVEREPQKIRQQSKRDIQEVKTLGAFLESKNDAGTICGVVQIPTEEMLLLWNRRQPTSISFRQIQQQDLSFECGQDRLIKGLSNGEFSTLLFAVQPYQGRLFYSVGNGRDWQNIYISEVENKCNPTLSYILEEQVDQKYFLSEGATNKILNKL